MHQQEGEKEREGALHDGGYREDCTEEMESGHNFFSRKKAVCHHPDEEGRYHAGDGRGGVRQRDFRGGEPLMSHESAQC